MNSVAIFNVKPDLLLVSVIISSLFFEPLWAIFFSVYAGILKDILSVYPFGIHTLSFFFWSLLIIGLSRKIILDNFYVRLALMFIIAVLNSMIMRAALLLSGIYIPLGIFFRIVALESVYTAFIFALLLKLAHKLWAAGPVKENETEVP